MNQILIAFTSLILLQNFAWADQTKPTPDDSIESILLNFDCAGVADGHSLRFKAGKSNPRQGEYEIVVETKHPTFSKSFVVIGSNTSESQYAVHGNTPEPFMFIIDKFGVHGAHNSVLAFPFNPNEKYDLECYFY